MSSFEEMLEAESSAWVDEGLITAGQRTRLLARHPVEPHGAHRFMAILAMIGGALFIVGVSLVIKANWDQLGDWLKIGGLVALLVGTYGLGWKLKIAPGHYPKTGDACFMAGAVAFLLGIALVSQIFHIDSRPPNGVLLWWVGIAVLPWLVRAKGMQFVSAVAGCVWLGMELGTRDSWLHLGPDSGRGFEGEFVLFTAAAFLVGVTLVGFGFALRGGRHAYFAGLHEKLGLVLATAALYALGFSWSAHRWFYQSMQPARLEPVVLLSVLAAGALGGAWRRSRQEVKALGPYLLLGLVPAGANLLGIELHDSNWLWGGLACLAMFLLNLGMIRAGLAAGRESWINLGMAGIALNIVTRYFLLFGTMLEGGVFFIVTGLLVLGLGFYLERKRRRLVGALRKEVAS
jgi:uncharacterized membrane protein